MKLKLKVDNADIDNFKPDELTTHVHLLGPQVVEDVFPLGFQVFNLTLFPLGGTYLSPPLEKS